MSKKMIMLLLLVTAPLALPASASAQEDHISGVTTFTGSGGASTFTTSAEPTINCNKNTVSSGSFDSGSTTTGKTTLDFTECTAEFLGATPSCNTSGAASGTIGAGGIFHIITWQYNGFRYPSILITWPFSTVSCAGFLNITIAGNVIGTITSPACGTSSKVIKTSFASTGATQEHTSYTSKTYNLTAQTSGGTANPSGWNGGTVTLTSATTGTLECT